MKVETKYNVDDTRYYLHERKVVKAKISSINLEVNSKGISKECYDIQFYEKGYGWHIISFSSIECFDKQTATTKEEMINKLFAEV